MSNVIDLTRSDIPDALNQVKKRELPPSITGVSSEKINSQTVSVKTSKQSVPSFGSSKTAYEANLNNRNILHKATVIPYKQAPTKLKVAFSLVSSREFTATAHSGVVETYLIDILKLIPGARFDWDTQRFIFPISSHDLLEVELKREYCEVVSIPRQILAAAQLSLSSQKNGNVTKLDKVDLQKYLSDEIISALAPFQLEAVKFIIDKGGRALVADEMGLGKTRTAIAGACAYPDDWPVLVICPSSAKYSWKAELNRILCPHHLTNTDILVVDTADFPEREILNEYKVVVVSYTIFTKLDLSAESSPFNVIIVDESHYLKSRAAQRTTAIVPFVQKSRRAILLSGTPALSRPLELFTQLNALVPDKFPEFKFFAERYCQNAKKSGKSKSSNSLFSNQYEKYSHWGDNRYKGANYTQELHVVLTNSVMIRRLKKDILHSLPKKCRFLVKVPIENDIKRIEFQKILHEMKRYDELMKRKKSQWTKLFPSSEETKLQDRNDQMAVDIRSERKNLLMKLYFESGREKLPAILKHLQTYVKNYPENKILLFAHHKEVLDQVSNFCSDNNLSFIRIDGRTPAETRHALCEEFQNDVTIRIGVLGITAAGIALTLTAANVVFFLEFYWTPGALIQAEDRVHRIGQLRNVDIFYFFAVDSIDELLWPLIRKKMQLLGEFVEGQTDQDLIASSCHCFESKTLCDDNSLQRKVSGNSRFGVIDLEKDDMNDELVEIAKEIAASEVEGNDEESNDNAADRDDDEYDAYLRRQDCVDKFALKFIELSQSLVFLQQPSSLSKPSTSFSSSSATSVVVDLCDDEDSSNRQAGEIKKKRRILPDHMKIRGESVSVNLCAFNGKNDVEVL